MDSGEPPSSRSLLNDRNWEVAAIRRRWYSPTQRFRVGCRRVAICPDMCWSSGVNPASEPAVVTVRVPEARSDEILAVLRHDRGTQLALERDTAFSHCGVVRTNVVGEEDDLGERVVVDWTVDASVATQGGRSPDLSDLTVGVVFGEAALGFRLAWEGSTMEVL